MDSPSPIFEHHQTRLALRRWPRSAADLLQAWDGADRYLLDVVAGEGGAGLTLVLNDQCGALTLSLLTKGQQVVGSGDSYTAWAALQANAADNGIDLANFHWQWSSEPPALNASQALVRVPKELSLLEWQLASLTAQLPPGSPVWLAGMDKHLPRNLLEVLGRYLDIPTAGLGHYKARVFRARIPASVVALPEPAYIEVPPYGWQLRVDAGVFSRQQLDIGARFLLDHIPEGVQGTVCDLGCGNGVIGMMALQKNPQISLWSCDESALAISSARHNLQRYFPQRSCSFYLGNGLDGLEQTFDWILLNPPFHRGHAVDDSVARMLFRQAGQRLRKDGVLRVIGNRHLVYEQLLKKYFRRVAVVAQNPKFTIVDAIRC